ncbi:MAG: tetratricopeptide repeat protein [Burkholderiales bacterium]
MANERLELALSSHMAGDLPLAEAIYRAILEEIPDQPDALHFLGILMHQRDRSDAGLDLVVRSLQLAPHRADWHNDMGNMLVERGLFSPAAEAFLKAIQLEPENPVVWNNLGSVLEKLGQHDDAESAFGKAVALDPEFPDPLNNLGNLLTSKGREVEAAHHYCRAYVLAPLEGKPKSMLGIAYCKLGRISEAAEIYRQWMMEEPDNPTPYHLYASCSGLDVPERASNAYIEKIFDEFSAHFDVKMKQLSYQGHRLIQNALARVLQPGGKLTGLDAGCGTGLCGPLIRPYFTHLAGVDLSSGMLEVARRQGVYDELSRMELTGYLASRPGGFDVIVSADTLIYFGSLGEVLGLARQALKPGGLLIFTIEEAEDGNDYTINPNGRYSHGRAYLQIVLVENGFELLACEAGMARFEFGKPVDCLVVTASAS